METTRSRGIARWFLDRSGAARMAGFIGEQGGKPVPAGLSWIYTTGALALFFFAVQFASGCLLLTVYVPDEDLAYRSVATIEHQASLGWLVRQLHSWGATFIVVVLLFHMLKVLWYGTYKRPREFTWLVGMLLLLTTLGFCFSGYLLPWNQLAFWATRVGVGAMQTVPVVGERLTVLVCGGPDVTGTTLGRFFALHVIVLPVVLSALVAWHLALITWKGLAPKTTVAEELRLGSEEALRRHGSEPFFPRQVYRDLLACNLGFALLVTAATFWPWELGEPADPFSTPEGIRPEWYFLPVYQFLKYFDNDLYQAVPFLERSGLDPALLGVLAVSAAGLGVFLLPFLDRGRERRITRRPFFAVLAFVVVCCVVALGGLGYISGRTVEWNGKTYRFSTKGYPELVQPTASAAAHGAGSSEAPAPAAANVGEPAATASAAGAAAADPEAAPTFRPDGLAPGGTCAGCHEEQVEEWTGSRHFEERVQCADCHGGRDTTPPEELMGPLELVIQAPAPAEDGAEPQPALSVEWPLEVDTPATKRLYLFAHQGIKVGRRGRPDTPRASEVPEFCGRCHEEEKELFLSATPEHSKSCVRCHSNHEVLAPARFLWEEKGYTDPDDPRTSPFQEIGKLLRRVEDRLAGCRASLDGLQATGYPIDGNVDEKGQLEAFARRAERLHPMVHGLDAAAVERKAKDTIAEVDALRERLDQTLSSRDDRWVFAAGVWAVALFLALLCALKLRAIRRGERAAGRSPRAPEGSTGAPPRGGAEPADTSHLEDEREALLHPLAPESVAEAEWTREEDGGWTEEAAPEDGDWSDSEREDGR